MNRKQEKNFQFPNTARYIKAETLAWKWQESYVGSFLDYLFKI